VHERRLRSFEEITDLPKPFRAKLADIADLSRFKVYDPDPKWRQGKPFLMNVQSFETTRRLWEHSGLRPADVDLPQVYDGFSPFVWFWLEALGFCPVGEAHAFVTGGGIDSDSPTGLPALSGGGALGNGRMHGVPQMLECYLQLSGRAGDRQLPSRTLGLACHSSPHFGGAVLYTNQRL